MEKEEATTLSGPVIEGNFQDLGDILEIARAEGQKKIHIRENICVMRIIAVTDLGIHIAVVSDDKEFRTSGLRGRNIE